MCEGRDQKTTLWTDLFFQLCMGSRGWTQDCQACAASIEPSHWVTALWSYLVPHQFFSWTVSTLAKYLAPVCLHSSPDSLVVEGDEHVLWESLFRKVTMTPVWKSFWGSHKSAHLEHLGQSLAWRPLCKGPWDTGAWETRLHCSPRISVAGRECLSPGSVSSGQRPLSSCLASHRCPLGVMVLIYFVQC